MVDYLRMSIDIYLPFGNKFSDHELGMCVEHKRMFALASTFRKACVCFLIFTQFWFVYFSFIRPNTRRKWVLTLSFGGTVWKVKKTYFFSFNGVEEWGNIYARFVLPNSTGTYIVFSTLQTVDQCCNADFKMSTSSGSLRSPMTSSFLGKLTPWSKGNRAIILDF